jgi:hypothetical protein
MKSLDKELVTKIGEKRLMNLATTLIDRKVEKLVRIINSEATKALTDFLGLIKQLPDKNRIEFGLEHLKTLREISNLLHERADYIS